MTKALRYAAVASATALASLTWTNQAAAFCAWGVANGAPYTNVFALQGTNSLCTVAPSGLAFQAGFSVPGFPPGVSPPIPYTGYAFLAYGGGQIIVTGSGTSITSFVGDYPGATTAPYGVFSFNDSDHPSPASSVTFAPGATATVSTTSANAFGLYASGGATISSSAQMTVMTNGTGASGVVADANGQVTLSGGASIVTTGDGAHGAQADSGGVIVLAGGSIQTSGAGSDGLTVSGDTSAITASNVAITTGAGVAPASGGVGVFAAAAGSATLTGGSVATNGASAPGLYATGEGSSITASSLGSADLAVTTNGAGSPGAQAGAGGALALNGVAVATSGQDSHALAVSGSGSKATLTGSNTFSTGGNGAIGLYASAGGAIAASGATTVLTSGGTSGATGLGAAGINADGAGSTVESRRHDHQDDRRPGLRASGERRGGQRQSRLDHHIRAPFHHDDQSGRHRDRPAGRRRLDFGDRRRNDRLRGRRHRVSRRNEPERDLRQFHDRQPDRRSHLRRSVHSDRQFQQHDGERRDEQPVARDQRQLRHAERGGVRLDWRDHDRHRFDLKRQPDERVDLDDDRLLGRLDSRCDEQRGRLRPAEPRGRVQDLDGRQLFRLRRVRRDERGAGLRQLPWRDPIADKIVINGGSATGQTLLSIRNTTIGGAPTIGNGIPVVVATNGGTIGANAFALATDDGRRRLPVFARTDRGGLLSRRRPDDDRDAGGQFGQRRRQGATAGADHRQGAEFDPSRRDRTDQLLELQFRLRIGRLLRARRAWPMEHHARTDRDRRFLVRRIHRPRHHRQQRADLRRRAHLRSDQFRPQPPVCRNRRRFRAL